MSMSGPALSSSAKRLGSLGWTCATCRNHVVRSELRWTTAPFRSYANSSRTTSFRVPKQTVRSTRRRQAVIWAATGTGVATGVLAGVLAFGDQIKYSYEAAERTGRVASGLAICINDYRTTLNQRDRIEDDEERERLLKECHKRCAERTLRVLERNGGIFIKLGQHLSAMNYLLPIEWTSTFIPLQDKCPVSSFESIEQMYRDDTGEELLEHFSDFSTEPIGAASLAQVHLATIRETGQKVAVKVQHPALAQWAPLDLALTRFTFSSLKRFFPEYDLEWLSSEIEVSLPQELDFQCEAKNALRTKEYFSHLPELPLVIPDVIWAKKRILVMANESGHRLDDLSYIDANNIDRDEVSATLAHIFNEMIFGEGAPLHCDPHGGNIAIRKNPTRRSANFDIILYDHGLYRDIPLSLRRSYAKMWLAIIDGDVGRMRKYVGEVAGEAAVGVGAGEDEGEGEERFRLFVSAITGRDFGVVRSASILAPRSQDEKKTMSGALQEGMLADLVQMLGRVPRVLLLIFKTNDLTRSLDESLHTRLGPVRSFLILARYCMRTVFHEQVEEIRRAGSLFWPPNAVRLVGAWLGYARVEAKLEVFELWLSIKRMLGLRPSGIELGGSVSEGQLGTENRALDTIDLLG